MKNLKKMISALLLSISVLSLTPGMAFAQGKEAITTDALNFRDSGSVYANVLSVIPMGTTLEVLQTSEKWAMVTFNDKTGWVSLNYIIYSDDVKATTGITSIKDSQLRKTASFNSTVLDTLKPGSMATLLTIENGWFKISYNGTVGYVYAPEWIPAPAPLPTAPAVPAPISGTIDIFSNITVYMNASDAEAKTNGVGTYAAGEYLIYKNYGGMVNITKHANVPGAWINPTENKDNTPVITQPATKPATKPAATTTATKPAATTAPATTTATASELYNLGVSVNSYTNAWDAKDSTNPVGKYAAGTYYVFKNYGGMLNLTRTKGEPGAWINPAENIVPSPAPSTKPAATTTPVTKPAATTAPATKPNPDTITANSAVNMRKDASTLSEILRTLPTGAKAVMIGKVNNWVKIEYEDQIGYSYISYWDIPSATLDKYTVPASTQPAATAPSTTTAVTTTKTTSSTVASTTTVLPKFDPKSDGVLKVYLDPGHMGVGKGAISTVTGEMVDENTINYRVAVLTKEILEAKGYTVYISKDSINDPIDLPERAAEANALGVDIFVSIHCNTFNSPDASGTLGFWAGEKLNPAVSDWQLQSKTLAQYLSSTVGSVLGKYSAPSDTSYGSSFYVNRETTMPSTLLELGFISNYQDATILNAEASQKDIAVQVAKGIDQFFNK